MFLQSNRAIVTGATQISTQITSKLVVPGSLVEYPPFPGNLKIYSSNLGGGNLLTITTTHPHTINIFLLVNAKRGWLKGTVQRDGSGRN